MKYMGMPMGMWALFAGSFQKQLIAVLCYDADTAKAIRRFKTACGMSGDLSCSLTSFSSERSSAVQRWHQSAGHLLVLVLGLVLLREKAKCGECKETVQ